MMDSQENTPLKGKIEEENQTEQSVVSGESVPVEITTTDKQSELEPKEIHEEAATSQDETDQPSEPALDAAQQTETELKVSDTDQIPSVEDTDVSDSESQTSEEKTQGEDKESLQEEKTDNIDPAMTVYTSRQDILARVTEIARGKDNPEKAEVDHLKTSFYKLLNVDREAKMKAYIDGGGDPDHYSVLPDDTEEAFKAEMQIIKEKRSQIYQRLETEKEENLKKKEEIIEKIKSMATSPEAANKSYQEFKALQQEWKEIRAVPPEKANELWRNYQLYVEQFYDLLNLNREAREYDFKKNLELKTKLCEEAEKLAEMPDVISAFHQLQELHQEYRETGPVSKDLREKVWARFKAASTVINKKHQEHFEQIRTQEKENLEKKTALCEKVETIADEENKGAGDWEKHTKEIIAIQTEWRKIGFAPQKMNVKIFQRFRVACDKFFDGKAEFFKNLKSVFAENIEKKKVLVEKAKSLTDSTDWHSTTDKLIALQKEWKTIGMVPKKEGDKLWEDFLSACNHFFEARNAANAGTHKEEHENLDKKNEIIGKLQDLLKNPGDNVQDEVQKLVSEYNNIGHVPYKDKDKIYKVYHDVLDQIYTNLHVSVTRHRLENFRSNLKNVAERGESALDNERGRLMHRYESLKQEINTYENNLGFLNAASKKGNTLIEEMNRKVQRQKDNLELVRQQIKAIDQRNREAIKGKLAEKKVASPSKERKDQSVDTVSDGNEDTDQSVSQEAKTD
jgi:DNA repair exonuclease SbcCD ATPase subunit